MSDYGLDYAIGVKHGWHAGYTEGFEGAPLCLEFPAGKSKSFRAGYAEGYKEGWRQGYDSGLRQAIKEYWSVPPPPPSTEFLQATKTTRSSTEPFDPSVRRPATPSFQKRR